MGAPLVGVPTQHPAGARSLVRSAALASGFNSFELPANDDGSTAEIKLPFKVNYFGRTYGGVYVNNNGNLTFGASQSQYTPQPLGSITLPIIAPFWADVDTRVGNVVTYGSGTVEGHQAFGVNWPGVGCYAERDATTNTFQVLLISRSDIGTGDFDIEFNYGPIEWESGQASGGNESCLEGVPARAGYASGTGLAYELAGSGVANALLSSDPTGLSNQSYGSTQLGTYVFTVRGGSPSPEASALYAALGDSYSSGEGDGSYAYGSGGAHNHCDRSPYAYGPLLASGVLSTPIAFVACSGAITDDFVAPNHEGNKSEVSNKLEAAQLGVLGPATETVTWTVGGNDVGFSELEKCFFARWTIIKVYGKSGCSKDATLVARVHNRIGALGGSGSATTPKGVPIQSMVSLLLEAHARAPEANIYVAGYPRLLGSFSGGECGVGQFLVTNLPVIGTEYVAVKVASADAAWIDSVVEELNTTLENAVSTARALTGASITFVDPNPGFETHRLCDSSNTWLHEIEGEYNYSTKKITYVFPGSFHPTPEGQEQGYESAFLSAGL